MRGRAIFLLYQLGPGGPPASRNARVATPIRRCASPRTERMRRAGLDILPVAARLAARRRRRCSPRGRAVDARSAGARRRSTFSSTSRAGIDGQDRSYLEALGTGATGKEAALYAALRPRLGVKDDPLSWSPAFTRIAWRLHVPAAVADLTARASATQLSLADRRFALDTLAFIDDPAAAQGDAQLRGTEQPAA